MYISCMLVSSILRMALEDGQIPWLGVGVGLVLGKKDEVVWYLKEESVALVYVLYGICISC